jgi:HTH-type transcriptional regulator, sugar sensing transcriptional regulator
MQEDIIVLERIGLTKNDRRVYLALLELGSATVSNLAKKTGLHRSYVYDILDKLIDVSLANFIIKNNKKYFNAENPERVLQILKNKEEEIKESEREISEVLPELIQRQKIAIEKQEARIFLGKEGIKSILEDILKIKREFKVLGAEGKFKDIFKWYFYNWQIKRVKSRISNKIIYNEKLRGLRPLKEQKLTEVKFLSENNFPSTIIIYGSKIAIIIWENNPIAFLLESESAKKTFENYFEMLWKIAKK